MPGHAAAGAELRDAGQFAAASEEYRRAVEENPKDHDSWRHLAACLSATDQHEEAALAYNELVKLRPADAAAWYDLAQECEILQDVENAKRCYQHAVARSGGTHAAALSGYAWALSSLGEFEECVAAYARYLEVEDEDAVAWHNYGHALESLSEFERAADAYRRAVELAPEREFHRMKLLVMLMRLGRLHEADGVLRERFGVGLRFFQFGSIALFAGIAAIGAAVVLRVARRS